MTIFFPHSAGFLIKLYIFVHALSWSVQASALNIDGGSIPKKVQKIHGPQNFVRLENFKMAQGIKSVVEVRYGNKEVGYFQTNNFSLNETNLSLKLIPPTYRKTIEFRIIYRNALGKKIELKLGERKYVNPIGNELDNKISVLSSPNSPFFIMDWAFEEAGKDPTLIPVVINRLGEVVWIYYDSSEPPSRGGSAVEVTDQGRFIFLRRNIETRLEKIDSWGNVEMKIDFSKSFPAYASSHSFQFLTATNEIVFLSYDCRRLPWYKEFISFFEGPQGWLRLIQLPRRTYLGSKIIRMSLKTLEAKEIWNTFDTFSPKTTPSLALVPTTRPDQFIDVQDSFTYKSLLQKGVRSGWDSTCNVDWSHENSVLYQEGRGYLVSIRNFNQIILLDERGHIQWTMGEHSANTFHFSADGTAFSMQHSPLFIKNGHILLFDNHTPYRGYTGIPYWNRLMEVDPVQPGSIRPQWIINLPVPPSEIRGSVSELQNNNYFAFSAGNAALPSHLLEIDPKKSVIVGHIEVRNFGFSRSIEAKAFQGFAGDEYLGLSSEPVGLERGFQDVLEFSY